MQKDIDKCQSEHLEEARTPESTSALTVESDSLIPEGYVATATLLGPTGKEGSTPIQLDTESRPLQSHDALAAQRFSADDVGKKVACIRMAGTESIMIMGFCLPQAGGPANDIQQDSLLDDLLTQSQSDKNTIEQQAEVANEIELDLDETATADLPQFQQENDSSQIGRVSEIVSHSDPEEPEHLVLRAGQTVTIKCGESSLTLAADGRIKINGRNIFSRASQLQRISGGAIKLN